MSNVVPRTLLDTDIFSELMRGKNEAVRARADTYLQQHGRLTISTITILEVAKGLRKAHREDALERFVQGRPAAPAMRRVQALTGHGIHARVALVS